MDDNSVLADISNITDDESANESRDYTIEESSDESINSSKDESYSDVKKEKQDKKLSVNRLKEENSSSDDESYESDDKYSQTNDSSDSNRVVSKRIKNKKNVILSDDDSGDEKQQNVSFTNNNDSYRNKSNVLASDEDDQNESESESENNFKLNKNGIISDDESINEERVCFSPRARYSMTGIRPKELSSDSSEEDDYNELDIVKESFEEPATSKDIFNNNDLNKFSKTNNDSESPIVEQPLRKSLQILNNSDLFSSDNESDIVNSSQTDLEENTIHKRSILKLLANNESVVNKLDVASDKSPKINASLNTPNQIFDLATFSTPNTKTKEEIKDPKISANNSILENSLNIKDSLIEKKSQNSSSVILNKSSEEVISILSSDSENESIIKAEDVSSPITVQKKITTMFETEKPKTNQNKKFEYVSEIYYNQEKAKLDTLKEDCIKSKILIDTMRDKLPDKGFKMRERIKTLELQIAKQTEKLDTLKIETVIQNAKNNDITKDRKSDIMSWDDIKAQTNAVQPRFIGKVGLSNFESQKTITMATLKDMYDTMDTCPSETVLATPPKGLKVTLMAHQLYALTWMMWREKQKPRGGILADDMGLGKTLTMISLILLCNEKEEEDSEDEDDEENEKAMPGWTSKGRKDYKYGGTLVVCPASLVRQWETEIQTKLKRDLLSVYLHHGNNRETKARRLAKYDVVLTTYNIVAREKSGVLSEIKWERVILDEAHVIRNHKSLMAEGVFALLSKCRWALTGTPIQNKELDAFSLIKYLRCSPFDDLGHWKKWIDNKSIGGQQRLATLMKSLLLRRTKTELLDKGQLESLPLKELHLIEIDLDKDEMNVYQKILVYSTSLFAQFLNQRAEREENPFSKNSQDGYYKLHKKAAQIFGNKSTVKAHEILVLLLRLRQICCHPGLINSMLEDDECSGAEMESSNVDLLEQLINLKINDDGEEDNGSYNETSEPKTSNILSKSNAVFDFAKSSSKIRVILDILQTKVLANGDKAVIVSQWPTFLTVIGNHLSALGLKFTILTGKVQVHLRNDIVKDFNRPNGSKILLLSLTAGGVGLNLVGGNHLFLADWHWNPQLEAQAQDRVYRVGQAKAVHIYKIMCKDTIEQHIKKLQSRKLEIASNVLTGKCSAGSKLTLDDMKGLFGLE